MPNWKKIIVSGSDASLNSVFANNVTASVFSGSFTGSLFGTSSWAVSASWAPGGGAAFPYTGSAIITGSLVTTGSIISTLGLGNFIELVSTGSGNRPYIKLFDAGAADLRIYTALSAIYGNINFPTNGFSLYDSTVNKYAHLVIEKLAAVSGAIVVTNAGGDAQVNIASPSGFSNYVSFRETGAANRGVIGYANGTSYLQIRTNGATSMTTGDLAVVVDNTGSVGIGTTSPTAKLDVNGSGNFAGSTLKIENGNIELGVTGGNRYLKTNLNPLRFFIGSQLEGFFNAGEFQYRNRIAINSTAADGAFPEIYLSSSLSKTIASARGAELNFAPQVNDIPTYGVVRIGDAAYGGQSTLSHMLLFGGQNTTTNAYGDIVLQHDGTVARGRVGIGKLSPNSTLDINGNTIITGSLTVTTGSNIEFQVLNTGVRIGNLITDIHTVTGSLGISGSVIITGSLTSSTDINVNTFTIGRGAGNAVENIAFGLQALARNTTATRNTAIGWFALSASNAAGASSNTAVGAISMRNNLSGTQNSAFGEGTLFSNTSGQFNTAVGYNSLASNTDGGSNVAVGWYAGDTLGDGATANTTADNSIYIGYSAFASQSNGQNEIVIGASNVGHGSNTVTLGNSSITRTILRGAVSASGGITGSLFGTASFATSASWAPGGGGGGISFPYTGSAVITGSLVVTGSFDLGIAEFNSTSSATTAGTTIVSSYATASYNSAFYNYYISSGSNARAGNIMSVWSGSTIQYTEVTTNDIGNTNTASFAVTLATGNVRLSFTAPGVWTVRSIVNLL